MCTIPSRAGLAAMLFFVWMVPGCAYYSFTGATIPSSLNTIAIPLPEDDSASPITDMDERLADLLVQRFVRQTRLSLEQNQDEADAVLTSRITQYRNEPTAVSGDEQAALNRLSITVDIRYFDQTQQEELLRRSFSSFEDYDPVAEGLEGERAAALAVLQNIADEVFAAATSNW